MKKYIESDQYRRNELTKMLHYPSWIKTRTEYQLEKLLDYVLRSKHDEEVRRAEILMHNPQMPTDWPGSQALQDATTAERIIRAQLDKKKLNKANASRGGKESKRRPDTAKIEKAKEILQSHPLSRFSKRGVARHLKNHGLDVSETWVLDHKEKYWTG